MEDLLFNADNCELEPQEETKEPPTLNKEKIAATLRAVGFKRASNSIMSMTQKEVADFLHAFERSK